MMKTHIAIATTNGLVMVQQLTQEDEDVMSLVCLGLTSKQLSVSAAYADFVKKGSGLIAKDFGHGAWRLDISANIDSGDSWQLPVYLAHQYYAKDELGTGEPASGDVVVISTGALSVTRQVKPVEHIAAKQRAAAESIEAWRQKGVTCRWIVHADNAQQLNTELEITTVATLDDLDSNENTSKTPQQAAPVAAAASSDQQSITRPLLLAIGAVVLMGAAWFFWSPEDPGRSLDDFGGSAKTLPDDQLGIIDGWKDDLPQIVVTQNDRLSRCGKSGDEKEIYEARSGSYFPTVSLGETCDIVLKTEPEIQKVWLVGLDTGAIIELSYVGEWVGWRIPMPDNQNDDRPYGLLMFNEVDRLSMKDLRERLSAVDWQVTEDAQALLLKMVGSDASVLFHKLEAAN